MFSNKFVIAIVLASLAVSIDCGVLSAVPAIAPAVHAVAPAPIAYHHAVPYNVPPYSDRVDIHSKVLSVPAVPAIHAVPAAVPAVHALPAPVHPALPAVAGYAAPYALPHHAPYALPHHAPLAYAQHAIPAAIPAPVHAAYAYGHPGAAAPVWRR